MSTGIKAKESCQLHSPVTRGASWLKALLPKRGGSLPLRLPTRTAGWRLLWDQAERNRRTHKSQAPGAKQSDL